MTCRNKKTGGKKTQTRRQAAGKKGGMEGILCQSGGAAAGEGGGKPFHRGGDAHTMPEKCWTDGEMLGGAGMH